MHEPKDKIYDQPPPPSVAMGISMTGMAPLEVSSQTDGQWSTGLCDCFDDGRNCCITLFCPCITFGQIAEIVDEGSSSCLSSGISYAAGFECIISSIYRSRMRKKYSLQASPCNDRLVTCCCDPCALCQEYRELKHRGFNMDIGYEANLANQGLGKAALPPNVQAGMDR